MSRMVRSRTLRSRSAGSTAGSLAGHPVVRWSLWLGAGVFFGLGLGFVLGLARPRPRVTP